MKVTGPTPHDICGLVSAYLRLSKAYDKKGHPPSRFENLGTPEERDRQLREDLERAYGDNSPFFRVQAIRKTALAASSQLSPPPAPSASLPAGRSLAAPERQPRPKSDVQSVPFVRLPNGLLSYDWSSAHPT